MPSAVCQNASGCRCTSPDIPDTFWSMDFKSDGVACGRRFRKFNTVEMSALRGSLRSCGIPRQADSRIPVCLSVPGEEQIPLAPFEVEVPRWHILSVRGKTAQKLDRVLIAPLTAGGGGNFTAVPIAARDALPSWSCPSSDWPLDFKDTHQGTVQSWFCRKIKGLGMGAFSSTLSATRS